MSECTIDNLYGIHIQDWEGDSYRLTDDFTGREIIFTDFFKASKHAFECEGLVHEQQKKLCVPEKYWPHFKVATYKIESTDIGPWKVGP